MKRRKGRRGRRPNDSPPPIVAERKKIKAAEDDEDVVQSVTLVHVAIPDDEDDFAPALRSAPSFKAVVKAYLPVCDAMVVLPWLHEECIIVPREWILAQQGDTGRKGHYLLDEDAAASDGRAIGGEYTPATVIEELDDGDTLVLQLTDFDPTDWFGAYAVCTGAEEVQRRFKEEE